MLVLPRPFSSLLLLLLNVTAGFATTQHRSMFNFPFSINVHADVDITFVFDCIYAAKPLVLESGSQ